MVRLVSTDFMYFITVVLVHHWEDEIRLHSAAVAAFGSVGGWYDSWDRVGYSECSKWCFLAFTSYSLSSTKFNQNLFFFV